MTAKARFQRGGDILDVEFSTPEELERFLRMVRFGEPVGPGASGGAAHLYPPLRVPANLEGSPSALNVEMPNMEQVIAWIMRFNEYRHSTSDLNRIFFPPDGLSPKDQKAPYNRFLRVVTKARARLETREGFRWQTEGKGKALTYSRASKESES